MEAVGLRCSGTGLPGLHRCCTAACCHTALHTIPGPAVAAGSCREQSERAPTSGTHLLNAVYLKCPAETLPVLPRARAALPPPPHESSCLFKCPENFIWKSAPCSLPCPPFHFLFLPSIMVNDDQFSPTGCPPPPALLPLFWVSPGHTAASHPTCWVSGCPPLQPSAGAHSSSHLAVPGENLRGMKEKINQWSANPETIICPLPNLIWET